MQIFWEKKKKKRRRGNNNLKYVFVRAINCANFLIKRHKIEEEETKIREKNSSTM